MGISLGGVDVFFFFQAEDGIRDIGVTGVQTCALPILAFNFLFLHADLDAAPMRRIVEEVERLLPPAAWPVWTGSNHDAGRLATRWAGGDEDRARVALMLLLTLRGTPVLYAGDELALGDVEVPAELQRDPV